MPLADINFGEVLLVALEVALLVIWLWILFAIITDLFRDRAVSGWGKAAWVFVLIVVPFLGALIYLIARGSGMQERAAQAQAAAKQQFDDYIRAQAQPTPADELLKLTELKEKGVLSNDEFERAKTAALA